MLQPEETIISQYAASPVITSIITGLNGLIDPRADISTFYDYIFNPGTAEGVGLDIWARIVGLGGRDIVITSHDIFGFYDQLLKNFDNGTFYGPNNGVGVQQMSDSALRQLIFLKAKANISRDTLADINDLLGDFLEIGGLDRTQAYVRESGTMQITVNFGVELSPVQEAIISQYGIFANGAGVEVVYEFFDPNA